jgi:hypothetical protein
MNAPDRSEKNRSSETSHSPLAPAENAGARRYVGGCHCGAVRFAATLDPHQGTRCNCSICTKVAQIGVIVAPAAFELTSDPADVSSYEWASRVAKRCFCRHCGVHCFGSGHVPELGGDFVSVNLNCLDDFDPGTLRPGHFDGRHDNWMAGTRETPWPIVTTASP